MFAALRNEAGAAGAITPEMLAKNVSEAVGHAVGQAIALAITQVIAGYQRANRGAGTRDRGERREGRGQNAAYDFRARSPESPMVVHGDTAVLQQLRRDMGIDSFVFEEESVSASLRSADVSARQPAEVLPGWSEMKWLASELGNVRDPETIAAEWTRDPGTSPDTLSPWALPARVGASLAALDIRPGLASFAADATAWLRAGTSQLFDPFRVGEVRGRTWVVLLIGASALLRAIGKG